MTPGLIGEGEAPGTAADHREQTARILSKGGRNSQLLTTWESKLTQPNFPEKLKIQNVYVKFLLFTMLQIQI